VDDVLKGLLQGVHQERQARLALGGCQELQQDQHVEQRDQDQQVTLVGKTAGKIRWTNWKKGGNMVENARNMWGTSEENGDVGKK